MPDPTICLLPYLPLDDVYTFGDWRVGPVAAFEDAWSDDRLRDTAKTFLSHFTDVYGDPLERPSILVRRNTGINGEPPSLAEVERLAATIQFAALGRNPRFEPETASAHDVLTTDNCDIHVTPIDVDSGFVTLLFGSFMVRTKSGGWRIGDEHLRISPPLELHLPTGSVRLEETLLQAAFALFAPDAEPAAARLKLAARWHAKVWRNTPSIAPEDRVIFLKTGFEALLGSDNFKAAKRLRRLFETLKERYDFDEQADPDENLLWRPSEVRRLQRRYTDRTRTERMRLVTDLEYWFMALSDVRNDIIHEGRVPSLAHGVEGIDDYAYAGDFVFVGEWMLRNAMKIEMSCQGYPDLWRPGRTNAAFREIRSRAIEMLEDRNRDE